MSNTPDLSGALGNIVSGISRLVDGARGPARPPDSADEATVAVSPRVLVIVFNPIVDSSGTRLLNHPQCRSWNKVDSLVAGYVADVAELSGGLVRYNVVDRVTMDAFPIKEDRFRYDGNSYLTANRTGQYHSPDYMDYGPFVDEFRLLHRVANNEIDEVWLFGGPGFGFFESRMCGPGAFWCNAPAMPNTDISGRRFVIMGFSYERGVGEMLEDLGHRAESIMGRVFKSDTFTNDAYAAGHQDAKAEPVKFATIRNAWERFSTFDKITPGRSNVGLMHFAPNSVGDYDWGNSRTVLSCADDWLQYPRLPNPPNYRPVNAATWGGGDIRVHHKWWFQRIPRVPGRINGVRNNWWHYIINVNDRELG